ncbi:MAG: hypothetical protein QE271_08205 [Bacteriovoracaceae bacterium]|nr:hypothetical protein [Bacteriovoracaceae bacterium]
MKILSRTNKLLLLALLSVFSFTYYWDVLRSKIRFTDETTQKRTLLYYLPEIDLWKDIAPTPPHEAWHLTQEKKGEWRIDELKRPQTRLEMEIWQKDFASILLDEPLNNGDAKNLSLQACPANSRIEWSISMKDDEVWTVTLCEPRPLTGKFLVHLDTVTKKISRSKESWFWGYTDRAFDGLYRDMPDRYTQSFYSLKKDFESLSYVSSYRNFLSWILTREGSVSELKSLQVSYPGRKIYELNFQRSQLLPTPTLPMKVDPQKIVELKNYFLNLRPIKVVKGKLFKEALVELKINDQLVSIFWPNEGDVAQVYYSKDDLTFTFPGRAFASKILFIQNFYDKKIPTLAPLFKKNLIHLDWEYETGKIKKRLIRPDLNYKSFDAETGLETKEILWQEIACYIYACNPSHEFLKFSATRPPQLDRLEQKKVTIEGMPIKIFLGPGIWWMELSPNEYYLFAEQGNLWHSVTP